VLNKPLAVRGDGRNRLLLALVQFFPLSLFATYAFWRGQPNGDRWISAFILGAVAATIQLAIVLPRPSPVNRLILGANLYLLVGGAGALARQWWVLRTYGRLNESGIFLFMLVVGIVTTFSTSAGFVGVSNGDPDVVRRYSLWLLGATAAVVTASVAFQGNRTWSAVAPLIGLALLQRLFVRRVSAATTRA
jgi:hypothetical protein